MALRFPTRSAPAREGHASGRLRQRTKRAIVIAEVALAVTLLTGAGLLLRSFTKLLAVDPGFRPEGVLTLKAQLPLRNYDVPRMRGFMQDLETRVRSIPGVQAVGLSNAVPLDGTGYGFSFTIRGRPVARPSDEPSTEVRVASSGFFDALGIPMLRGRGITPADRDGAPKILVVNRAFADRFFPNEDVVGQFISLGWGEDDNGTMREIVGVVGNVHSEGLAQPPEPTVYAPEHQAPHSLITLSVRTSGDPATFAAPLRRVVRELDGEVPVFSIQTMQERVAGSVGRERFFASLISVFAGVAVVLSAVGLYGVIAYAVSQRRHELGVRVALGATADRISRMVLGEGMKLVFAGAALGIVGALAAGGVLSSLLFGVDARDPVTLGSVVVVIGIVAILASWLPARRAARVDPLVAMRGD